MVYFEWVSEERQENTYVWMKYYYFDPGNGPTFGPFRTRRDAENYGKAYYRQQNKRGGGNGQMCSIRSES